MWTGDRAIARGWPNDYLSESVGLDQPTGSTAQGVIRALAEAELVRRFQAALKVATTAQTATVTPLGETVT